MPVWLNRNSFVLAAAAVILTTGVLLLRDGVRPADVLGLSALAAGAWAAFYLLRPPQGSSREASSIQEEIGAGQAVLLEFQSPY